MSSKNRNTIVSRAIVTNGGGLHVREIEGGESRIIAGYAILFNAPSDPLWSDEDSEGREVIAPEAVTQELLDGSDIKFTMYHNREIILARSNKGKGSLSYSIDARGVYFEFEAPNTAHGDEALELVKRGDISGCSFMFRTYYYDSEYVERTEVTTAQGYSVLYTVKKITGVYDFTLAADPAYPQTSVEARELVKSLRSDDTPPDMPPCEQAREQVSAMRAAAALKII